jgi:chromosome segregation ATPase
MVTVEQVRQLEVRVAKAIDYVNKVTDENILLKNKLDSYQKRIDELEVMIQRFKEDQGRIEEGILSALERLNRFEDDVHKTITSADEPSKTPARPAIPEPPPGIAGSEVPSPAPVRASIETYEEDTQISPPPTDDGLSGDNADSTDETSELDIF